ncbi:MAG: sigma-70 family RNA polymerase sigma factor [Ruminococcus sp.]|nr:sigma-70 family RNA polymerase sigma factor [Ruminococcus sp.]
MDFDEIYRRYFKEVYYYVRSLCADESLCEEIAQETFFKALKKIDSFDGRKDIRAWLFTIAKNSYLSYLRKNHRDVSLEPDLPLEDDRQAPIEDRLTDSESAYRIHESLHGLREPYKEVFSLRVFGELNFERIGKLFGKSAGWARVTYYRAKMMILKELEEHDGQNQL